MARTKRKMNPVQQVMTSQTTGQHIYRVGGYVRLSMTDSGKPGADTIENQKELIREYVDSQSDMELSEIYCDNGQTGTNFERPEFEKLMQDMKCGKLDCIVVKDLSRFGRNYLETGNYLEKIFPFFGVRFVAISERFDTISAERTDAGYIVPLRNIINEAYSRDISRKVGSAYAVKRKKGEFTGTWPAYGYIQCVHDPHKIMPDAETAWVVQDIFRWRLSGMGYALIARKLNRAGIPSPCRYHYLKGDARCERYADSVWSVRTLQRMLSNEVYLGHMVQGRKRQSFYEGKEQRFLPKAEWTVVKNTHEPIIEEDVFRAVQNMSEEKTKAYWERRGGAYV